MRHLKQLLNERATDGLRRLGYSNRMMDLAKREAWWWLDARGQALKRRRGLLSGQAVFWTRLGYAELVDVEVPLAGPGEVTVEVLSSAISPGTERAAFTRLPNTAVRGPSRPGYSAAGIVAATGAGVEQLRVGELIAVRGASHASVVTVPVSNAYKVAPGVSAADACLINLGIIAGQGVRLVEPVEGKPVCVIGAGLVGALAQRVALASGAGETTVIATSRRKEPWARAGGAKRFLVTPDDYEAIAALEASVVIEATGDPAAIEVAVRAAGAAGRISLLGSPRGVTTRFPVDELRRKRLEVVGAHVETLTQEQRRAGGEPWRREGERFLADLGRGTVSVSDLLPRVVDPREAASFYRALVEDRDLFAARFDWTLLPRRERIRRARTLRVPDISGRGADSDREPLSPARARGGARGPLELGDQFAGATGRLRVALIGCGDIAVHNAAAVAAAPNAVLSACYDPVAQLADDIAQQYGAATTATADELVSRPDVDAVFLAVPHHLHAPLGALAAEHGKHLMVEKPPANDLGGALELVAAAERNGVALSFCFPQRYEPEAVAARRLIEAGALGALEGTVVRVLQERSAAYRVGGFSGRSISNWRNSRDKAGGGVLIMNLCHYIELVRHLCGVDVETVTAFTDAQDPAVDVEDAATVAVRFSNGAVGTFFASTEVRGTLSPELRLWGRDGHVVIQPQAKVYTVAPVPGVRASRWQTFGALPPWQARAVYVSRFATAVSQGRQPEISVQEGLATQAFIEAAYRSSVTGETVSPRELIGEALTW